MDDKTYYVKNCSDDPNYHFPALGYLLNCAKCGKKIHVCCVLVGTNHNLSVSATCGDCMMPLNSGFAEKHPEAVEKIEQWLKE